MKTSFAWVLSLGISCNAMASAIDGRWYFVESRCVAVNGEQRREPLGPNESMMFDFSGDGGSGVAMVRNAQGLCMIEFNMHTSPAAEGGNRIFIERHVRGDSPKGCSDHMTADQSAYEFSFKQDGASLELKETRPGSEECRTRTSVLTHEAVSGK